MLPLCSGCSARPVDEGYRVLITYNSRLPALPAGSRVTRCCLIGADTGCVRPAPAWGASSASRWTPAVSMERHRVT